MSQFTFSKLKKQLLLLFALCCNTSHMLANDWLSHTDSICLHIAKTDSVANDSMSTHKHKSLWGKITNYFRNSNKQKANKKIDFGFIPGPNYSATTGFGLGFLGTATYSADRTDATLPRSNASIYSNMTTGGFFMIGLRGNHIFPHEQFQLDYKVNISTFSNSFWGDRKSVV